MKGCHKLAQYCLPQEGFCWFLLLPDTWWCWLSVILTRSKCTSCSDCPGPQGAGPCAGITLTPCAALPLPGRLWVCRSLCVSGPVGPQLPGEAESEHPADTSRLEPPAWRFSLSLVPLVLLRLTWFTPMSSLSSRKRWLKCLILSLGLL